MFFYIQYIITIFLKIPNDVNVPVIIFKLMIKDLQLMRLSSFLELLPAILLSFKERKIIDAWVFL